MNLVRFVLLALAIPLPMDTVAAEHACAADARTQAEALLRFHLGRDAPVRIDDEVRVLPSLVNPVAPGQRFDVLELQGHQTRAHYRIRLLYARVRGPCVLMGQEILELARL